MVNGGRKVLRLEIIFLAHFADCWPMDFFSHLIIVFFKEILWIMIVNTMYIGMSLYHYTLFYHIPTNINLLAILRGNRRFSNDTYIKLMHTIFTFSIRLCFSRSSVPFTRRLLGFGPCWCGGSVSGRRSRFVLFRWRMVVGNDSGTCLCP